MLVSIKLHCPNCQSTKIVKNGNKKNKKQNYLCKTCKRQFIGDHNLTYKGWASCSFDEICTNSWEAFTSVFQGYTHKIDKKHTTDIEGNNTLLRHRIRRAVRKTCCFSKKLETHIKAFEIVFFYINFGWI